MTEQSEIRIIEGQDGNRGFMFSLLLDAKTLNSLAAQPLGFDLEGMALIRALVERGAVYQDATDIGGCIFPAVQVFSLYPEHRTIFLAHYQHGRRQDPAPGIAAMQHFSPFTGKKTCAEHYQADALQDPISGDPAWQYFDEKTGRVIKAQSYDSGKSKGFLKEVAFQALNLRLGLIPPPVPAVAPKLS
jgi:hypothetical protein